MHRTTQMIPLAGTPCVIPGLWNMQFDFDLDGHQVQVHGFGSQVFFDSEENNFASMQTSPRSFAYTDGGLSIGIKVTDHFQVGAQRYVRPALDKGTLRLDRAGEPKWDMRGFDF
jgi:hypothetical protein